MTAPNILNLTTATGTTLTAPLTTVLTTNVITGTTNQVYKINSIIVSNINGTTNYDAYFSYFDGTNDRSFCYAVTVPAKSILSVIDKANCIYVTEISSIRGGASANSMLNALISYEIMS